MGTNFSRYSQRCECYKHAGIKDDMTNAGAIWHDEAVVVDGHIVSSRRPPDLPDYMREFIKVIAK